MRAIRRVWRRRLLLDWEAGLRGLPFFTQRTAGLLLGVLVATLALLGGVVATSQGPLDPVEELLGPVVDTLLP